MSLVACVQEAVSLLGEAYEFYYVVSVLVVASLPGVACQMGFVACVRGAAPLP